MFCKKFCRVAIGLAVCTMIPLNLSARHSGWSFFSKFQSSDARGKVAESRASENVAAQESGQGSGETKIDETKIDETKIGDILLWYIPNRVCDFVDIFSIELGAGPNARVDLYLTRACALGGGFGDSYMVGWDRRFFGGEKRLGRFADEFSYDGNIICVCYDKCSHRNWFGNFPSFRVDRGGLIRLHSKPFVERNEDFWQLGVDLGLLIDAKVMIHPLAICDFITGLVCIDLEDDDYTSLKK